MAPETSGGISPSLTYAPDGTAHVAYRDATSGVLRHAYLGPDGVWVREVADGTVGAGANAHISSSTKLRVGPSGGVFIVYETYTVDQSSVIGDYTLRYVERSTDGTWSTPVTLAEKMVSDFDNDRLGLELDASGASVVFAFREDPLDATTAMFSMIRPADDGTTETKLGSYPREDIGNLRTTLDGDGGIWATAVVYDVGLLVVEPGATEPLTLAASPISYNRQLLVDLEGPTLYVSELGEISYGNGSFWTTEAVSETVGQETSFLWFGEGGGLRAAYTDGYMNGPFPIRTYARESSGWTAGDVFLYETAQTVYDNQKISPIAMNPAGNLVLWDAPRHDGDLSLVEMTADGQTVTDVDLKPVVNAVSAAAVDADGHLGVAYYGLTDNFYLTFALEQDDGTFVTSFPTLSGKVFGDSLTVDRDGRFVMVGVDGTDVMLWRYDGTSWNSESVGQETNVTPYWARVVFTTDNTPHIFYSSQTASSCQGWHLTNAGSVPGPNSVVESLPTCHLFPILDAEDNLYAALEGPYGLARWTGSVWQVAALGDGVEGTGAAIDERGRPCLVYPGASLILACLENGSLVTEELAPIGMLYEVVQVANDDSGTIYVWVKGPYTDDVPQLIVRAPGGEVSVHPTEGWGSLVFASGGANVPLMTYVDTSDARIHMARCTVVP